jgi:hypothetical protein
MYDLLFHDQDEAKRSLVLSSIYHLKHVVRIISIFHLHMHRNLLQELPSEYRKELLDEMPLLRWSTDDVADWLSHQNMVPYIQKFRENNIDGYTLSTMTPVRTFYFTFLSMTLA